MKLYHGSTMAVRKPTISRGRTKTDFGKGFYTTTNREQAEKWAQIKKDREKDDNARAVVSIYEVDDNIVNNPAYKTLHYEGATTEWLDFVVDNRRSNTSHNFDLVMGPVANDKLYVTISLYEIGTLSAEATIEQLKTHVLFDQLSFHTQRACEAITFIESYEL